MGQPSAGSSADIPGDPGATTANLIFFCEQCGVRVPMADLAGRKARQLDETRATCVNCSRKRSGASGALRQSDGSTRRSTRHVPLPARTEPRPSQRGVAAAPRSGPGAAHDHLPALPAKKGVAPLVLVGIGAGLLVVVGLIALASRGSGPDRKAEAKKSAGETGTKTQPGGPTVPSGTGPVPPDAPEKKGSAGPPVEETKTSPPKEEYDPRAAVAASLLAQAKAYFEANPDDPYEYKSKLEALKQGYARTPPALEAEKLLEGLKSLPPIPDQLDEIPEAKEYRLVYDLNLKKLSHSINYDKDERASITQPFDRIAYLVELKPKNGGKQWVFVSMDAFTDDLGKIGIPTIASGASFQQNVTNLNVSSNVDGVVTGTGLTGGNIEFWPNNYGNRNAANVPNAVDNKYDFGDDKASRPVDGYGCMQVHNHEAKQTIFAINKWRDGDGADLGIGNRDRDNPDWTFSGSGRNYGSKRLRVLVRLK